MRCIELVGGACHINSCFKVERLGPRKSDKYCAALLPVLGPDPVSGMRYRSTVPRDRVGVLGGWGSPVQPGSSDK